MDKDGRPAKDGINHRIAYIEKNGVVYKIDILTALNLNEKDKDNYGDKFYDIDINEKEAHDDQRAVKKILTSNPELDH